ncbi:hypothetical protein DXX93_07330 [Thalassotalea euphylliae]|uniref:Uncharacterized protein n=1 Tax=Thalassotalea euphylliae TaxID=1655234 RepID=A0A3E0TPI1_9GAMM|nr:hypothetical protein DXX93_07330 [Thalassotalea euphylliae]
MSFQSNAKLLFVNVNLPFADYSAKNEKSSLSCFFTLCNLSEHSDLVNVLTIAIRLLESRSS